jgi:Tfp pilus assembly protein PilV
MGRTAPSKLTGSQASLIKIKAPGLPDQSGFALLEIILAFAISVFVLGIALPAISQTVTKLAELRSYSTALSLAHSKLEEYAFDCAPSPRNYKGLENGFYWQVSVKRIVPTAIEGPLMGVYFLKIINVTVASAEHAEPLINLSAHRFGELSP